MASLVEGGDQNFYVYALISLFIFCPLTFILLHVLRFLAPYGKHARGGWGYFIPPSLAWFLMESPTIWLTLLLLPFGRHRSDPVALTLISFYLFHYIHRTLIYPLVIRKAPASTSLGVPFVVALSGFAFNLLNAYLQTRWVTHYGSYAPEWVRTPKFAAGAAVFAIGMATNLWADRRLVALKKEAGGGYKVPNGGLFELVSCPNYTGEIVEWLGWAILTWSWAGLAFFLYTASNLVPRAAGHHQWYLQKFPEEYPRSRKRVIPFVY